MVEQAEQLLRTHHSVSQIEKPAHRTFLVHCWRGGMRSAAIAWLLDMYGFKVFTLIGGYKKYRHWIIDTYSTGIPLQLLGGYTGSGKTYVLNQLKDRGQSVIDLEKLASHKGSAFGSIGMPAQPTQEHFENLLGAALNEYGVQPGMPYTGVPIWAEDESQRIGTVNIPQSFWLHMRTAPVYFLDIPFDQRLGHIVKEYGPLDIERLKSAVTRISRRLGGMETKTVLENLEKGEIGAAFSLLLKYYDKWYLKGLHNRTDLEKSLHTVSSDEVNAEANAARILAEAKN
jgi:tRNA 2-selenouridine synthase